MISLYRPGHSALHRSPAWLKLVLLAVFAVATSLLGFSWPFLAAAAVVVISGYLAAGFGLGPLWRGLVQCRWIVVIMVVPQLFFLGLEPALVNTTRVVLVVLLAGLITLTTKVADLLDTVERALGPFARFGISPTKVGLVLALTITTVPVIASFARQIRDAARARGSGRVSFRMILPLLVMSLQHGDQLADALNARGVA